MARVTRWSLAAIFILISITAAQIPILQGCFNSSVPLVRQGTAKYQSSGNCNDYCTMKKRLVLGLSNGIVCWCGNELPPADSKVPSTNCDTPCQGYDKEDCGGGTEYYTVWLTQLGADANVPNFTGSSSMSPTRTGSPTSSTGTVARGSTNSGGSTSAGQLEAGSGTNKDSSGSQRSDEDVAIAVGVVIGVAVLALVGFIFWCTARRRKQTGTFARFRDGSVNGGSVDGSSSALQAARAPAGPNIEPTAPEPEMTALPQVNPNIFIQQPTQPTTPANRSAAGVAAPVAAAPAAAALTTESSLPPGGLTGGSRASSVTDPFYTPLEQPAVPPLNQSEVYALRGQARPDSPRSSSESEEADDTLAPLESIRRPGDIAAFDFGPGTSPMPGPMPGYFGP